MLVVQCEFAASDIPEVKELSFVSDKYPLLVSESGACPLTTDTRGIGDAIKQNLKSDIFLNPTFMRLTLDDCVAIQMPVSLGAPLYIHPAQEQIRV